MTALIAVRSENEVAIYSDAVGYDDDGVAQHFHQKADIALHLPAIIATRGSGFAGQFFKLYAVLEHSFDDLIDKFEDILRAACHDAKRHGDPINLVAYVAGYSARHQDWRINYMHYSQIDGLNTPRSFELNAVERCMIDPLPSSEYLETMIVNGVLQINGTAGFVKMMQMIRQTPQCFGPRSRDKEGCIVGGFIQKTVLTADAAYTAIIHRWNDEIGKPLDPSND